MMVDTWSKICDGRTGVIGVLGVDLAQLPFVSGYGLAARVFRLNEFSRKDLFATLGLEGVQSSNLFDKACHSGIPQERLRKKLGIPRSISRYWPEVAWCPIDAGKAWTWQPTRIRHCIQCFAHGYHSTFFQMPFVKKCPWHLTPLVERCPSCNRYFDSTVREDGRIGRCQCGSDWFCPRLATALINSFPTTEAESYLHRYLSWCQPQTARRYLVVPSRCATWQSALSRLITLPEDSPLEPAAPNQRVFRWSFNRDCGNGLAPGELYPWMTLGASPHFAMARLPPRLLKPLRRVVSQVFDARLRSSESLNEWSSPKTTRALFFLNGAESSSAWIDLNLVEPMSFEECCMLLGAVELHLIDSESTPIPLCSEAERSSMLEKLRGARCLDSALRHILLRGYAIGLSTVVRHLMASPPDCEIDSRESVKIPAAEIEIDQSDLSQVSVVWIPLH